ncbi:MAG TPA: hypothetical protein VJK72_03515 [Candidatus Nanoarchaeia archaeon]|nr:hypothetical protein [Candidatus Nanoarchaeia archaeon]
MALNNKGLALILDVALGTVVIMAGVALSVFFISESSSHVADYQLARIGADILGMLDAQQGFDNLDHATIEQEIAELLPAHLDMLVRIEGDFEEGDGIIEVGGNLPSAASIIPVRRVALTSDDTYLKITAYVWLR